MSRNSSEVDDRLTESRRRVFQFFVSACLTVSLVVLSGPTPVQASNTPLNKRCKSPALAAGLEWGNPDPLYLQLKTNVRWQNCRGILRKVVIETRWMDYSGGLESSDSITFSPDVTQFRNGVETKTLERYLTTYWGVGFTTNKSRDDLQSCTKDVIGKETTSLNGDTFYAVITGYNKANKQILQLVTPAVQCGQNG